MTNTDLRTGVVGGLGAKAPCRVATITNIALEGLQTINGTALVANDRVLVRSQTDLAENGVYIASTGEWQRAVDFDDILDGVSGTLMLVVEGAGAQAEGPNVLFVVVLPNGETEITFDTTEIEFEFFAFSSGGGGGTYLLAGNNLSDINSPSVARINLGLMIGNNVQAYNVNLQALAALIGVNNKIPYFTGVGTMALTDIPTQATEIQAGIAQIATQAEMTTGINDANFSTPLKVKTQITNQIRLGGYELRSTSTNYLADYDGFLVVTATKATAGGATISIYSDANPVPLAIIAQQNVDAASGLSTGSLTTPIKKGNYYSVGLTGVTSSLIFFIKLLNN